MLCDRKSQNSVFKSGNLARYHGPYKVLKGVGNLDSVIETPDRRKSTQMYHVNMVKQYFESRMTKRLMATDCNLKNNNNMETDVTLLMLNVKSG